MGLINEMIESFRTSTTLPGNTDEQQTTYSGTPITHVKFGLPKEIDSILIPGHVKQPEPKYFLITSSAPGIVLITSPITESLVISTFVSIVLPPLLKFFYFLF